MTVPSVTALSQANGGAGGGTAVNVTGTSFIAGSTVAFGANAATGVVINSTTSISCVSPAGVAGTVDVEVTNSGGTSPANPPGDSFTYLATPVIPANFVDIDYTQRSQILTQIGNLINTYLTYWTATATPVSVPDPGGGGTYINAGSTFTKYFNALVAVNTQYTLGVATPSVPAGNLDWSSFQSAVNGILAYMRLLAAAKP